MSIYEEDRIIGFYDLDKNSKLTPISIIKFFNEISLNHNDKIIKDKSIDLSGKGWMINRWKVKFNNIDKSEGKLKIRTWISEIKRFFVYREFEVLDENSNIISVGTAEWIFIDMKKRRPTRLNKDFIEATKIKEQTNFRNFSRYPKNIDVEKYMEIRVRRGDIDSNQHVNNLNYIIWFLETIPEKVFKYYKIKELEIEYRQEATYPSSVVSKVKTKKILDNKLEILHQIDSNKEEIVHAYGKTLWESAT